MPRLPHANVNSKLIAWCPESEVRIIVQRAPLRISDRKDASSNIRRRGSPSGRDHQHSAFRQFFRTRGIKSPATSDCVVRQIADAPSLSELSCGTRLFGLAVRAAFPHNFHIFREASSSGLQASAAKGGNCCLLIALQRPLEILKMSV